MARQGGSTSNYGTLYEFDPTTNIFLKKMDFDSVNSGAFPAFGLTLATNNKLYGMTLRGGAFNWGTLFEYDPYNNIFSKKYDFQGLDGAMPSVDNLVVANNGKLYGITKMGGVTGQGILFEYDFVNSTFIKKHDFSGNWSGTGLRPSGLMQGSNGKLYGVNSLGGATAYGVIYEYDYVLDTLIKKFEAFDYCGATNGVLFGSFPTGRLTQGTNGMLYGMTVQGGTSLCGCGGIIFELDPNSDSFVKKNNFNATFGCHPEWSHMIILDSTLNSIQEKNNIGKISLFPNPATEIINIQSSSELGTIIIYNSLGEIVSQMKSKNKEEQIDVSKLTAGIYVVSVNGKRIKLVKE